MFPLKSRLKDSTLVPMTGTPLKRKRQSLDTTDATPPKTRTVPGLHLDMGSLVLLIRTYQNRVFALKAPRTGTCALLQSGAVLLPVSTERAEQVRGQSQVDEVLTNIHELLSLLSGMQMPSRSRQ